MPASPTGVGEGSDHSPAYVGSLLSEQCPVSLEAFFGECFLGFSKERL